MKFGKNLQRVVDISDPEWAPYWTNYKMLKKLIKELPSLVPSEDASKPNVTPKTAAGAAATRTDSMGSSGRESSSSIAVAPAVAREAAAAASTTATATRQNQGDETAELGQRNQDAVATKPQQGGASVGPRSDLDTIGKSPGEIAFFKLLHAEFKKATHFFERAQEEYIIREERVRKGMEIMKQPNSIMVGEKWSLLAKSIYRLYKDLLLLETFAIMTYCGFSKILKKHDKVTGYHTRNAFMANIVNKANFTNYPKILEMISRCEQLYEEVSDRLMQDGQHGLYEDERLFINMISRLNEQVIEGVEGEGAPARPEPRKQSFTIRNVSSTVSKESWATSSLRQLVNENDARRQAGQVSESNEANPGAESDCEDDRKQPATSTGNNVQAVRKRKADEPTAEQKRRKS